MKERLDHLIGIWHSLTFGKKFTLVSSVLGLVLVSSAIIAFSGGSKQMRSIVSGTDSKDLGEVVEVLKSNQIPFEYGNDGQSILVPSDQLANARMNLAMKGLPRSGEVGFEIFDEGNFGVSDFVQRTNHTRAIQGELARTISMMDSVRSAKVFVVKPENNLLLSEDPNDRPSSSVYVDTGGNMLDRSNVNAIQFLVARAVKGVNKSNVAVLDNQGNLLSDEGESDGTAGVVGQMMKAYQAQERRLEQKIETMLSRIVGKDNVVARVSVNLNTKSSTLLDEQFDPEGQVPRTQTTDKDSATTVESQPQSDATGLGANVPNAGGAATQDPVMAQSDESRESKTTDFEISRTLREEVQEPGSIMGRSAAVLIAKGDRPRTPAEIDSIHNAVVNAIGARFDQVDLNSHVTVHEVEFLPSFIGPAGETFNQFEQIINNYGHLLQNLLGVVLALAIFFIFLRMLKKFKPNDAEVEILNEVDQQALSLRKNAGDGLTPELLNDLIQEKPDNVGIALRKYLDTGSIR